MKRLIVLALVFVLLLGSALASAQEDKSLKGAVGAALLDEAVLPASGPESQPYLALYVEYEKTDEYCTTHAKATLLYVNSNGKSDNPAAKDLIIELKTEDTLELVKGSDYHVFFDDLPCGGQYTFEFDLFCAFPMEQVDQAPEPKLTITAKSSNAGSCEYTCTFDSMTEPRALVWGWETGDTAPDAIKADLWMMSDLFGRSYYNRQKVDIFSSYYNHNDIWQLMHQLPEMETDHNDVTYIYLNAHGVTYGEEEIIVPGFQAYAPGTSITLNEYVIENKDLVLYNQFFSELRQALKGRIVVILDICFAGKAISRAEGAGFEPGQLSLMTCIGEQLPSGVYDNWFAAYGWFTKELYDEFSGRTGVQTIGEAYDYMKDYASSHFTWFLMDPQFTGNADTAIFCLEPDAWIEDPELVVVEETLVSRLPVSVVITTETYADSGEHFRARIVRPHVYAEANPDLTAMIDAELDKLYLEKFARLEERKSSAARCGSDMQTHTETLTLTSAYSNGKFVTFSLQSGYFMCTIGHDCNETFAYIFDVATGERLEFEDLLDLENNPEAKEDFIRMIGEQLIRKGFSDAKAGKIYSEMLKDEYARWDLSPQGVKILIDSMYFEMMCGSLCVPYEQLDGILKKPYLPQAPAGQLEVSIAPYDAAAISEETPVYDNTPAANILTLSGMADHIWVENSYGRNEVDGGCSYFYAYCPVKAQIMLPNAQNASYGYAVAWIDAEGEHIKNMNP